jgi:hypothetical protein
MRNVSDKNFEKGKTSLPKTAVYEVCGKVW